MTNNTKPGPELKHSQEFVKYAVETVIYSHSKPYKNNPPIITLCGSTSFKHEYRLANRFFTINGWIVLSVGGFHHLEDYELSELQKSFVDQLHFEKIAISDAIFVINRDNYIGDSTQNEINHAKMLDVSRYYLEG